MQCPNSFNWYHQVKGQSSNHYIVESTSLFQNDQVNTCPVNPWPWFQSGPLDIIQLRAVRAGEAGGRKCGAGKIGSRQVGAGEVRRVEEEAPKVRLATSA